MNVCSRKCLSTPFLLALALRGHCPFSLTPAGTELGCCLSRARACPGKNSLGWKNGGEREEQDCICQKERGKASGAGNAGCLSKGCSLRMPVTHMECFGELATRRGIWGVPPPLSWGAQGPSPILRWDWIGWSSPFADPSP